MANKQPVKYRLYIDGVKRMPYGVFTTERALYRNISFLVEADFQMPLLVDAEGEWLQVQVARDLKAWNLIALS